jgi:uncharacterized protein (DUF488 family)
MSSAGQLHLDYSDHEDPYEAWEASHLPRRDLGTLVTFGYQKVKTTDGLAALLDGAAVDLIVDVRLKPYSGNRTFSTETRANLEGAGWQYAWEPDLGNLAYKTGGIAIRNIETIEPAVLAHLRQGRTVALMCVCYDAKGCHRRTISDEAVRRLPGLVVRHL